MARPQPRRDPHLPQARRGRATGDLPFTTEEHNPRIAWHTCALFINDNVATQIDGLGHITVGEDNHWYNGFKEADWGGNFGIRKRCDHHPAHHRRGVLIDVAGFRKVDALPPNYHITADDSKAPSRSRASKSAGHAC